MHSQVSNLNSKLVCIRFKIERKCIKNGVREERRQSIIKLEQEKKELKKTIMSLEGAPDVVR